MSDESRSSEIQGSCSKVISSIDSETSRFQQAIDEKIKDTFAKQTDIDISLHKILESLNLLTTNLDQSVQCDKKETLKVFKSLEGSISQLDKDIKDQNLTRDQINELKHEYDVLMRQNDELKSKLEKAEYNTRSALNELAALKPKLQEAERAKIKTATEIAELQRIVSSKETDLKNSESKATKSQTTHDSKMRAQQELYKLVTEERDKTRKELEELRVKLTELGSHLTMHQAIELENKRREKEFQKTQAEKEKIISSLEKENADLKTKLGEFQLQQEMKQVDDLEITADAHNLSVGILERVIGSQKTKPGVVTPKPGKQRGKLSNLKTKRKILLTDDIDGSPINVPFIDDFELNEEIHDYDESFKPKRYTKRKRTKA
jgi:DNA repair exonuclease SbcCD ATPase subunit